MSAARSRSFARGVLLGTPLLFGFAAAAWPAPVVEVVAELRRPAGWRFEQGCVGGLSAVDFDSATGRYLLLSDGRAAPAAYSAKIALVPASADEPARIDVELESRLPLSATDGTSYTPGTVDPEGLAASGDGSFWVSSEGVTSRGIAPFVRRFRARDGRQLDELQLPTALLPRLEQGRLVHGVANNLGLEALTLSADGQTLWIGTEATLVQERGGRRQATILRYRLDGEEPSQAGQWRYPMRRPPVPGTSIGLVELLVLPDGRLLSLERAFGPLTGVGVGLFEIALPPTEGGKDGKDGKDGKGDDVAARLDKRAWTTLAELGVKVENYEGMTFVAAEGESIDLLLVSDNNAPGCDSVRKDTPDTAFLWLRVH